MRSTLTSRKRSVQRGSGGKNTQMDTRAGIVRTILTTHGCSIIVENCLEASIGRSGSMQILLTCCLFIIPGSAQ
eukprot:COSAG02_NODE_4501_length_5288_cov_7.650029_2_plen_74_part_00